jgi:hypothetical protein
MTDRNILTLLQADQARPALGIIFVTAVLVVIGIEIMSR